MSLDRPSGFRVQMKNYDKFTMFRRPNRRSVTIGDLKRHRLLMKNSRRAANGMAPKSNYSEI
jgi:hypothetical protein